jgi:hypothetical protein
MSNLLAGHEFNKRFPSTVFVKLTNETELHNGFQFKTGLNVDIIKFDPTGECKKGGIYFCEYGKIAMWIRYNQTLCINYRIVTIPDDALVYIERDKYKADKMILSDKKDIRRDKDMHELLDASAIMPLYFVIDQTEEICKEAVKQNAHALRYVKDQTEEICKIAVAQNGNVLYTIKDQTEEICKIAVKQNGIALQYVEMQTDELCKIAVAQNGNALRYVNNQTYEMCKIAVAQKGNALQFVKDQSMELCEIAVAQNRCSSMYVRKPIVWINL